MESKNRVVESSASRKLGLSCAECRRSKLKCDRSFPCQSCIRRGCAGICPEGTLAATKGNKVLMAHAQRLSEQVNALKSRVQELECTLAKSQGQNRPLLGPLASSSAPSEADTDVSDAIGSLSIGAHGQSIYHGDSASSEYFQDWIGVSDDEDPTASSSQNLDLPLEIFELSNAFPFGLKDCPYHKDIFFEYLPNKDRAVEITNLYYTTAAWMYDPITVREFSTTILEPIYGGGFPTPAFIHPHRLSVFFIILANGLMVEPHASSMKIAQHYYALSRAALSMESMVSEATCATIQALFSMIRYLYIADRTATEERWLITGITARIAQTIGLQRDGSNWDLSAEEVQRRRRVFWDFFVWDSWTSLVNGRPAALSIQHTDCLYPDDLEPHMNANGELEQGWHAWKWRYFATCVTAAADHVFNTQTPSYRALLALDKKIRDFPTPAYLRPPTRDLKLRQSWLSDPNLSMQQYCMLAVKDANLMYIHRSYFAQAIRQSPQNPLLHKYAPSVTTIYQCACRMIHGLRAVSSTNGHITRYTWYFWSSIFSACVILGALVVESPGCSLAAGALQELEDTVPFYEQGSKVWGSQANAAALEKLFRRASAAFSVFRQSKDFQTVNSQADIDDAEGLRGRRAVTSKVAASSTSPTDMGKTFQQRERDEILEPPSHPNSADDLANHYKPIKYPMQGARGLTLQDFDMRDDRQTSSYASQTKEHLPYISRTCNPAAPFVDHHLPQGQYAGSFQDSVITILPEKVPPADRGAWLTGFSNADATPHRSTTNSNLPPLYISTSSVDPHIHNLQPPHFSQEPNQANVWRNFMQEFESQ